MMFTYRKFIYLITSPLLMTFTKKVDDTTIVVDLSVTKLADVMQYCKPKEQFVLIKKF